jgi:Periplasmic copper-binding protein (NosD)
MLRAGRWSRLALLSILGSVFFPLGRAAAQNTIHVPSDEPTIQAAINAANPGDTVLVAPGTYKENVNFAGKLITVTSSDGPSVTTIDGGQAGSVVTFNTGEGASTILNGFTIQNGTSVEHVGGGIYINSSSPTVTNNFVQNNTAASGGAGIGIEFASPRIQGNTVQNNTQAGGYSGGIGGGGISVAGIGSALVVGNVIANNSWPSGDGGGITLFAAGTPTIRDNTITGNVASGVSPASQGGGIWIVNTSDAFVVQNLIYSNSAGQGSGIYFGVPSGNRGPILVNNTVIGGFGGSAGSAVYASGFDNQVQFFNNLLIGLSGQNAVYCDATYSSQPPTFIHNNAYSPNGTGMAGTCASQGTQNGNISADPQFVNPSSGDFHLQAASPAIDAGTNAVPNLPQTDFAGNPRILDGNNDCVSIADMGIYEIVRSANVTLTPSVLLFPNQMIGTLSSAQSVTLTNSGTTCFQFSSIGITGDYSQANSCPAVGIQGGSSCVFNIGFTPTLTGTRLGTLAVVGFDGVKRSTSVSLTGTGVDYLVSVSPSTATLKHGQSANFNISVTAIGGAFNSSVALSCSGLPSSATCSFSPASVIPGSNRSMSALTLSTSGKTPRGTFKVQIVGSTGSAQRITTVQVTVN